MRNKIIAITGHKGVIGSNFIKKFKNNRFIKCRTNVKNRKKIFKWIKNNNFDLFIHLAAIVPIEKVNNRKLEATKVNYIGSKNIVDAIIKYKKKNIWFFFSSTSHIYKYSQNKISENSKISPINHYGKTKYLAEKYIYNKFKKNNVKFCIGRIFSFTDVKQKNSFFIPSMFKKLKKKTNKTLILKNMNNKRDFVSVIDIAKAIDLLYKNRNIGIYNIGSGKGYYLFEIVNLISKLLKSKRKIEFIGNTKGMNLVSNIVKIKRIGWKPNTNLIQTLKKYKISL